MTGHPTPPWWLAYANKISVATLALFMLFWISGAIPWFPAPMWTKVLDAIASHDRNMQEGTRIQRVICGLLAKDDAAARRDCWRDGNGDR